MTETRDWQEMKDMSARLLKERTGEDVNSWNRRIKKEKFGDKKALREWLTEKGVTGYAKSMLIMETFGYPDFMDATADELINGQYVDRPHLRPIYEAVIEMVSGVGEVIVQMRKTYVSLVSTRRTFARVQATTKNRVDVALRLESEKPGGRLTKSRIHESMPVQISLTSVDEVDSEVLNFLKRAYDESS
jgi:hypothetical protein